MDRKFLGLAALVALGIAFATRGASAAPAAPGATFTPDESAEAGACDDVMFDRPTDHAGIEQGDVGDAEWLARVAFHYAYGAWPDSNSPAQLARLQKLLQCVTAKLADEPVDPVVVPLPPLPPPPAPGEPLVFDLQANWGGLPLETREQLARIELASGIPGIARALGVKAWQAFRAGQPLVATAQAAIIAAGSPDLCRFCVNDSDGVASAALLKKNTDPKPGGNGWSKPTDYAGWAKASYGLFDILGATAVHGGIHQGFTPLLSLPSASAAMSRWDVQAFAASYIVWRLLYGSLPVLNPGPEATNGDSLDTWANIFTAWASPEGFANKTQYAASARARYIARAAEIGISLVDTAYPWPPGMSYKPTSWSAQAVWARLQDYKNRPVVEA